ncbi:hypothetical protein AUP68_04704 [Ilyonectria robusta]
MIPDRVSRQSNAGVSRPTADRSPARTKKEAGLRRWHHKSRTGCTPCKSRRVKCDEHRPNCGNCTRLGIECEYFDTKCSKKHPRLLPNHDQTQNEAATSPAHSTQTNASIVSGRFISSQDLFSTGVRTRVERLLDLRLFHHYLQMTTQSTDFQITWAFWIVEEAVQSPHVMDALLGFSAFHLRRYAKSDQTLQEAAHKYMDRAIRHHREQIQIGFDEKNAVSIAAASALVSVYSSVNRSYLASGVGPQSPLHWFRSLEMGIQVLDQAQAFIHDWKMSQQFRGLTQLRQATMQTIPSDKFQFLLEYADTQETGNDDALLAYRQVLTLLSSLYSNLQHARPFFFFLKVPSKFVDLLAAKNSRALAILGYFFMVTKKCRAFWWMDGVPEQEFAAIMELLPSHWWPAMSWAVQEFEQSQAEGMGHPECRRIVVE